MDNRERQGPVTGRDDGGGQPLAVRRCGHHTTTVAFAVVALMVGYRALTDNVERADRFVVPAGLSAAGFSCSHFRRPGASRVAHAFRPRVSDVHLDTEAYRFVVEAATPGRSVRIIAIRPDARDEGVYREQQAAHLLADADPVLFLEVARGDTAEPASGLTVEGHRRHRCRGAAPLRRSTLPP